jgi:CIC family chloride channel protein
MAEPVPDKRAAVPGLPEVFAYEDETCRAVAEEMATSGILIMPVLDRETGRVIGSISAQDLLAGRKRAVERESQRRIHFRLLGRREEPMAEEMERTLD